MDEIDFEAVRYRSARYAAADSTSLGNYFFAIAAADSADDVPALLAAYGEVKADRDNLGVALEAAKEDVEALRRERDKALAVRDSLVRKCADAAIDCVKAEADRDRLAAQVARVREFHSPNDVDDPHVARRCSGCLAGYDPRTGELVFAAYPCLTVMALDGGAS